MSQGFWNFLRANLLCYDLSFIVLKLTPLKITRPRIPLEFCMFWIFMWRASTLSSELSRGKKGKV